MAEHPLKTTAEQVTEITKLVEDAQGKLDQVVRALRTLEDRLRDDAGSGAPTSA
jgi:isoaspartyl peptidase/L-asparaginase-like protein (Ntn-hydrolase superfamily)